MSEYFNSPGEGLLHPNFDISELKASDQAAAQELITCEHHFGVPLIEQPMRDAIIGDGQHVFTVDGLACYTIDFIEPKPRVESLVLNPPRLFPHPREFVDFCREIVSKMSDYDSSQATPPITAEALRGLQRAGTMVVSGLIKVTDLHNDHSSFMTLRVPRVFTELDVPPTPDGGTVTPQVYAGRLAATVFDWLSSVYLSDPPEQP